MGESSDRHGPSVATELWTDMQGKLMRDRIPEIIRSSGKEPVTYTAGPDEYSERLRIKLQEEVAEFLTAHQDSADEELADVLEVVLALAQDLAMTLDQLERLRVRKSEERGGFGLRTIWMGNVGT